jgi:hypothetical protein
MKIILNVIDGTFTHIILNYLPSKALSTGIYETITGIHYHTNETPKLRNLCCKNGNYNSFPLSTCV